MSTQTHGAAHGTLSSYISGFILSLALTIVPYLIVVKGWGSGSTLLFTLIGLAIAQLLIQLMFFLHVGKESKPHWNLTAFLFAALVVLILVLGSLWIMDNMGYHEHVAPANIQQQIMEEEGIYR